MLRTLGIPARMTSGYMVACKNNETTTITANNAHGWVEVYIENLGWVTVDVTPASDGKAELESLKAIMQGHEITLIADSASKLYDGKPLNAPQSCSFDSETMSLFDKYGIKYSATVQVSGSITEKGKTDSVIDVYGITVKFMDKDITDWFTTVKTKNGTLEIIKKDVVTVYLQPKKITYDGKPHRFEDKDFRVLGLPVGYTIEVELSRLGSITYVGKLSCDSIYKYTTIKDAKGNVVTNEFFIRFTQFYATGTEKVVNENYSLWLNDDLMKIVSLKLEVRSGDATATYAEDKTLKNETYVLSGSLAEGHEVKVIFTGERTARVCVKTPLALRCTTQKVKT